MISPQDIEKYLNDAELAISHLPELFLSLDDSESDVASYAVEALENCGSPRLDAVPFLCEQCQNKNSLASYWACTLLGRLLQEGVVAIDANTRSTVSPSATILETLCQVIGDSGVEQSTRERAMIALGHATDLDLSTRQFLEKQITDTTPRMARLIATALSNSSTENNHLTN